MIMSKPTKTLSVTACLAGLCFVLAGCAQVDVGLTLGKAIEAAGSDEPDMALALDLIATCVDAEPDNVTMRILHGVFLHMAGKSTHAEDVLSDARARAPKSFFANYFLGFVLSEREEYAGAIEPLEDAYRLRKQAPEMEHQLLRLLGTCFLEQKLPKGKRYFQVLRIHERSVEVYNSLGLLWMYEVDYEQAEGSFLEALKLDPANPVVLQNLAVLLDAYLNRPKDAKPYYRRALAVFLQAGDEASAAPILVRLRDLATL